MKFSNEANIKFRRANSVLVRIGHIVSRSYHTYFLRDC